MGSGKHLKRAQSKHGIENFVKEILYVFNTEVEMNAKEAALVSEDFCLREDTYNICAGGNGGFSYINRNGLNYKNFNSKAEFNRSITPFKNREFYDRYKEDHLRGSKNGRDKIKQLYENGSIDKATFKGKKHTEETKRKMSMQKQDKGMSSDNSQFGTMWITNGKDNRKISKNDNIPAEWYKGRKMS
jgi:hypothetical protein